MDAAKSRCHRLYVPALHPCYADHVRIARVNKWLTKCYVRIGLGYACAESYLCDIYYLCSPRMFKSALHLSSKSIRSGNRSQSLRPSLSYLFEDKNLKMNSFRKRNAIVPAGSRKLSQRRASSGQMSKMLNSAASHRAVDTPSMVQVTNLAFFALIRRQLGCTDLAH